MKGATPPLVEKLSVSDLAARSRLLMRRHRLIRQMIRRRTEQRIRFLRAL